MEYSVEKKLYTPFSRKLDKQHPKQWLQRTVPVINVTFDPRDPQKIILHDDNTICVVDKKKVIAFKFQLLPVYHNTISAHIYVIALC